MTSGPVMNVLEKNFSVTGERLDTLLNARSARVVEADDRHAGLLGVIHDFANFMRVHGAERSSGHRKVLAVGGHRAVADIARAGHHAVRGQLLLLHAEVVARVLGMHAELHERPLLEQVVEPVARGHEALLAAGFQLVLAASGKNLLAAGFQFFDEFFFDGHVSGMG